MNGKSLIYGILLAVCVGVFCFVSCQVGRKQGRDEHTPLQVDTLFIHDTIVQYKPKEVTCRVIDTSYIKADTVRIHDTLTVRVPIEQKSYRADEYYAVISGYRPSLDTIQVYQQTKIITKTEYVKQWRKFTYGVQLGVGGCYDLVHKNFGAGIYAGVGIGYNF